MGLRGRTLFDKQANIYFVTTTVVKFDRVFELGPAYNNILIDLIKFLLDEHNSELLAYVIMPHNIHMILQMPENQSIVDFMRDFKKFTSTKLRKQLETEGNAEVLERLRTNSKGYKNQTFKLWMDRFDDLVITEDKTLKIKFDYIHNNPVKAGLVKNPEDWVYSSARNYYLNDNSVISITDK